MNVADSQRLASALEALGLESSEKPENADVVVLNTCMVRQSAEDRALGRLGSLKPAKKKNPDMIIGLMGCMVVADWCAMIWRKLKNVRGRIALAVLAMPYGGSTLPRAE